MLYRKVDHTPDSPVSLPSAFPFRPPSFSQLRRPLKELGNAMGSSNATRPSGIFHVLPIKDNISDDCRIGFSDGKITFQITVVDNLVLVRTSSWLHLIGT